MPPKQPAIELKVWGVELKISEKALDNTLVIVGTGLAAAAFGLVVLYKRYPQIVEGAIKGALEAAGVKIVRISTGSIIVEVQCTTKESFLTFMGDFETKKVKRQLEEEFQKKLDFNGELEVTIINEKEVYKELSQLRQLVAEEEEEGKTEVGGSGVKGTSSAVPPLLKQKASEACFESSLSEVAAAPKRTISSSSRTGDSMEIVTDEEFCADVIFALDSSSAVSDKEFQMVLDFAKQMAASFSIPLRAIAFGDAAVSYHPDDTRPKFGGRESRMDLALIQAAESLNPSPGQKLIVLISPGRQAPGHDDSFFSKYFELASSGIRVLIVLVRSEETEKLLSKFFPWGPLWLCQVQSFDHLTSDTAKNIAFHIKKTFHPRSWK